MATNVKRVALIGAGYMGAEYAKALTQAESLELVGIMSRTRARAQTLADTYGTPIVADSVGELYARTEADAVIVAVPELAARDITLAAFDYPWTALLEKPPGYLPAVAGELLEAAERRQRSAFVALNRRFYGSTTAALAEVAGTVGPRSVIIQDAEDQHAALAAGQPKQVVDAWMYANSIHLIDYADLFCRGTVVDVSTPQPFKPYEPCLVESIIRYSSGDTATYLGLWQKPGPWSVQVCTAEARVELKPLEQAGIQRKGERRVTTVPQTEWDTECKPGIRALVEELGKVLRGEPHRLPTLAAGVDCMRVIESMFKPQRV